MTVEKTTCVTKGQICTSAIRYCYNEQVAGDIVSKCFICQISFYKITCFYCNIWNDLFVSFIHFYKLLHNVSNYYMWYFTVISEMPYLLYISICQISFYKITCFCILRWTFTSFGFSVPNNHQLLLHRNLYLPCRCTCNQL